MLTEITLSNATNKTVLLNGQIRKFTGRPFRSHADCQGAAATATASQRRTKPAPSKTCAP